MYKFKNVLITGGSSGLGKNLALNYAKNGARIINISRDLEKMNKLNDKLNLINNNNNLFYSADVSNYNEIKKIKHSLLEKNITPDIIINMPHNFLHFLII